MSFTLLSKNTRTARKRHQCIWCGESIPPGVRYEDERSVYDGVMQNHKWHAECLGACHDEANELGGDLDFFPYDNPRPEVDTNSGTTP